MAQDRVAQLEAKLGALDEEVAALRKKSGELEQRVNRLEVRDEIRESPGAVGDPSAKYE
jgi:phage shock protein A